MDANNENLDKEVTTSETPVEVMSPEENKEEVKVDKNENVVSEATTDTTSEVTTPETETAVTTETTTVETPAQQPEEKKEEVKVETDKKSEKPKKSGNTFAIILCIIGVICLGIGVFLTVTTGNDEESSTNNNSNTNTNTNTDKGNNNGSVSLDNIKNYVEYNNFGIKNTLKLSGDGLDIEMVEEGKYDVLSNVYYAKMSFGDMVAYAYHDITNHILYSSEDQVEWTKESDDSLAVPSYPGTIISKVKTNDGVTDLGNGSYSLSIDVSLIPDMEEETGLVPTTATFNSDGYLTKIVFDLKAVYGEDSDVTEYSSIIEFTDVNAVGTVSIPEDVINNAVESEW